MQSSYLSEPTREHAPSSKRPITIRLKRFYSLVEWEVVWEAFNLGINMAKKGGDVTVLLDMEAVQAANRHDNHQFQMNRGNYGSEKMISVQSMIQQFMEAGGQVVANERWAKFWGVSGGSMQALSQGVQLMNDEEVADFLVNRSGNIIDY